MSLLGTQPVSAAVGVMHYGMTQLPAQFAPIASSQASAKTIAPAPAAGWTIVVLAYSITCGATANTWNFQSHTTTSVATGIHALPINGSIVAPYCPAGLFACAPAANDAIRQFAEILDKHHAEGDCQGPKLADCERLYALVGIHKPPQKLRLEPAIGMGNERPGHAENPWKPFQMT